MIEGANGYCIFDATDKKVISLENPNNLLLVLELLREHELAIYSIKEDSFGLDLHAKLVAKELNFTVVTETTLSGLVDMEKFIRRFPSKFENELESITDAIVLYYRSVTYNAFSNIHGCSKLQYTLEELNNLGQDAGGSTTFKHLWDNEWYEHDMVVSKHANIISLTNTLIKYLMRWENLEQIKKIRHSLAMVTKYKVLKDNSKLYKDIYNVKSMNVFKGKE